MKKKSNGFEEITTDFKIRASLNALADKYNQAIRERIYRAYTDPVLHTMYNGIRNSGIFNVSGHKYSRKKILEFPDPYVFDFVDEVMTSLYGKGWEKNRRALNHELVKPWWVVNKI